MPLSYQERRAAATAAGRMKIGVDWQLQGGHWTVEAAAPVTDRIQ